MMRTTDIWLVAWLDEVQGIRFDSHKKLDRNRIEFFYNKGADEWEALKKAFFHSDAAKIKAYHLKLKDLFY